MNRAKTNRTLETKGDLLRHRSRAVARRRTIAARIGHFTQFPVFRPSGQARRRIWAELLGTAVSLRSSVVTISALLMSSMLLVSAVGCGYQAVGTGLVTTGESAPVAFVPAFTGFIAQPELDVWASSYLASQLVDRGFHVTSFPSDAEYTVSGTLVRTSERPVALHEGETIIDQVVVVQLDVSGGADCSTPELAAEVTMAVPLGRATEIERLATLQTAISQAIDALVLDVVVCVADAVAASEPIDEGPAESGPPNDSSSRQ